MGSAAVVLVIALISVAGLLWLRDLDDKLKRTDAFSQIANRPQKLVDGSLNVLVLGSDSREPDAPPGSARTDTVMIMHIPAGHDKAYVISLPRDLWLDIPGTPDGRVAYHLIHAHCRTRIGNGTSPAPLPGMQP